MATETALYPETASERSTVRRAVSGAINDSLLRNSSFLILNSVIVSALGFAFWTAAARFFPASAVGTTTTVISAVTYASMVGTLGLPNTVIRFLARDSDPVRLLTATGAVAAGAGALVGLIWYCIPGHLGIPLSSVGSGWITAPVVIVVVALGSLGAVAQSAIIALRKSKWVVVENGIASVVKLAALPLAIGFASAGLFGLFLASVAVSTVASIVIIVRVVDAPRDHWMRPVELGALHHTRSFAAGNHVAALASQLPGTVLRIVVLAQLGAQDAAYLAMPLMIVALLKIIPSTAAQSLFAEAAADEASLGRLARRTLRGIYAVLLPAIVGLVVLAGPILSIFGPDYAAAGTRCLQLLALSGLFAGFNYVADTIFNARRMVRAYVFLNIVGSIFAIGFPVALLGFGLTGVGVGWLLGQVAYAAVALAMLGWLRREERRLR
jgi:O-antigen/teichoic acid export membrane protein